MRLYPIDLLALISLLAVASDPGSYTILLHPLNLWQNIPAANLLSGIITHAYLTLILPLRLTTLTRLGERMGTPAATVAISLTLNGILGATLYTAHGLGATAGQAAQLFTPALTVFSAIATAASLRKEIRSPPRPPGKPSNLTLIAIAAVIIVSSPVIPIQVIDGDTWVMNRAIIGYAKYGDAFSHTQYPSFYSFILVAQALATQLPSANIPTINTITLTILGTTILIQISHYLLRTSREKAKLIILYYFAGGLAYIISLTHGVPYNAANRIALDAGNWSKYPLLHNMWDYKGYSLIAFLTSFYLVIRVSERGEGRGVLAAILSALSTLAYPPTAIINLTLPVILLIHRKTREAASFILILAAAYLAIDTPTGLHTLNTVVMKAPGIVARRLANPPAHTALTILTHQVLLLIIAASIPPLVYLLLTRREKASILTGYLAFLIIAVLTVSVIQINHEAALYAATERIPYPTGRLRLTTTPINKLITPYYFHYTLIAVGLTTGAIAETYTKKRIIALTALVAAAYLTSAFIFLERALAFASLPLSLLAAPTPRKEPAKTSAAILLIISLLSTGYYYTWVTIADGYR